jgi:ubiquinone/menaquinone biosynthesis C-methylase UbiE
MNTCGSDVRGRLLRLIDAAWVPHAIRAACALRLPELITQSTGGLEALAVASATHAPSLRRLLRALASVDLCQEDEDGSFRLTAMGSLLREDAPESLRAWALLTGGPVAQRFAELEQSVCTGESFRVRHQGANDFSQMEADPAAAAVFNCAMTNLTRRVAHEVLSAFDFSAARRIVDVGGGSGELLAAVLTAYADARGVLFDLAHAIADAGAVLERAGVADRCQCVVGSFFATVPTDGDLYLLKSVLHNWDDERCAMILANCRRAMAPGARLLVIERIAPVRAGNSPLHRSVARSDLNMLLTLGGRERSEAEYRALCETAGLTFGDISPTAGEFQMISFAALRADAASDVVG